MGLLAISKILLVFILPFLVFLLAAGFAGFDDSFYKKKFLEYGIEKDFPDAVSLHEGVIDFIKGGSKELPDEFNARERQHLADVRKIAGYSTILLYALIILYIPLLIASASALKPSSRRINFIGKAILFGGFLTLLIASAFLLFASLDFPAAFESFHSLFFEKGTYVFDPDKEIIVKIYPEQLFMELGARILKIVIMASAAIILLGAFLVMKSKSKKNKNASKLKIMQQLS